MRLKIPLIWTGIFLAHSVGQFVAWAMADGPSSSALALAASNALMFPAFFLAGSFADRWFWPTFVLNSVLWASAATWLVRRFASRRKRPHLESAD